MNRRLLSPVGVNSSTRRSSVAAFGMGRAPGSNLSSSSQTRPSVLGYVCCEADRAECVGDSMMASIVDDMPSAPVEEDTAAKKRDLSEFEEELLPSRKSSF